VTTLRLSWPSRPLWQNTRTHWAAESSAKAKSKREAWAVAVEAGLHAHAIQRPLLRFTFHPPDRRKRDAHNMPATMKGAIDGIAHAMRMDDSVFLVVWPRQFAEPVKGGLVVVEITDAAPEGAVGIEFRGPIS
jgi:crossover junction endodeoxyribonuclease RusA